MVLAVQITRPLQYVHSDQGCRAALHCRTVAMAYIQALRLSLKTCALI